MENNQTEREYMNNREVCPACGKNTDLSFSEPDHCMNKYIRCECGFGGPLANDYGQEPEQQRRSAEQACALWDKKSIQLRGAWERSRKDGNFEEMARKAFEFVNHGSIPTHPSWFENFKMALWKSGFDGDNRTDKIEQNELLDAITKKLTLNGKINYGEFVEIRAEIEKRKGA